MYATHLSYCKTMIVNPLWKEFSERRNSSIGFILFSWKQIYTMNSKNVRPVRVHLYPWIHDLDCRILEYRAWRVELWRRPRKFLSNMGILMEHDRVFVRWPEQLYFFGSCCRLRIPLIRFSPTFSGQSLQSDFFFYSTRLNWSGHG